MAVLSHLQPQSVFSYFERLCSVPHGSGNTKQISDLCVRMAGELGLRCRQDALNNVIIWKEASPGYEAAAPVILQGHMDMVCAKTEDCTKDMAQEGLTLRTDGVSVWAHQTSLGGDDGIALAMIFAVLADPSLPHPPLEAVFTVDEETGMGGAAGLDGTLLQGRVLLNIDSEVEGVFTVSCAGGIRSDSFLPGRRCPLKGETGYSLTLSGLLGGHSGVDIHRGRASANHLMGRILHMAAQQVSGLRLADLQGGKFDNVICNGSQAQIAVPPEQAAALEAFLTSYRAVLQREYAAADPHLLFSWEPCRLQQALSAEDSRRILQALFLLPQGVQRMNAELPGLVETSLNLGVLTMKEDGVHFTCSVRSSLASQKELLCQQLRCITCQAGGTVSLHDNYPGWPMIRDSALQQIALSAYETVTGKTADLVAIHAGLECGLFLEKLPGLEAISFGPDLTDIHSVHEKLNVASTGRTYALLCQMLKMLAQQPIR